MKPAAFNSREQHGSFFPSASARKCEEGCTFDDLNLEKSKAASQEDFNLDVQQCKDKKTKDITSHIEPCGKSAYTSMESPTRTKQKLKFILLEQNTKLELLENSRKRE